MKKNILILGSCGQIGRELTNYFSKNYNIIEYDIVKNKSQDLRKNKKKIEKFIKISDFVYFLAFDVGGSRYLKKYQKKYNFIENNILIMTNVFNLLKKHKKKFIFASSQMSNMSYSNYGILKRVGEIYTESIKTGIIVKFWNVFGIEKDLNKSHVITDFILQGIKNKKIKMLTDGSEEREFLYSVDCCEAFEIIMKRFNFFVNKKNEIHVTTFKSTKIIYVAQLIKKILLKNKISIKITKSKNKDAIQKNKKNKADKFFLNFWQPKINLEQGIRRMVNYYIK